jgi:hypothetical protein
MKDVIVGIGVVIILGIFLLSGREKSWLTISCRALCLFAAGVGFVALAQWSPQSFTSLVAGMVTTGLATMLSGWK